LWHGFLVGSLFALVLMMTYRLKDTALPLILAFLVLIVQPLLAAVPMQQAAPVQPAPQAEPQAESQPGQSTLGQVMDGLAPARPGLESEAPANAKPREFRGNISLLLVLSLLIILAFVLIFRALRQAKKSHAPKAWHE
jgi:hypothetical protein